MSSGEDFSLRGQRRGQPALDSSAFLVLLLVDSVIRVERTPPKRNPTDSGAVNISLRKSHQNLIRYAVTGYDELEVAQSLSDMCLNK